MMAVRCVISSHTAKELQGYFDPTQGSGDNYRKRSHHIDPAGGISSNNGAITWSSDTGMNGAGCVVTEYRENDTGDLTRYKHEIKAITSSSTYRRFFSEVSEDPWTDNTYNRIVFWIKPPAELPDFGDGEGGWSGKLQTNSWSFEMGTYIRPKMPSPCGHATNHASVTKSESDWRYPDHPKGDPDRTIDGHLYHRFRMMQSGVWNQFILDFHPTGIRNESGAYDFGSEWNVEYPYEVLEGLTDKNYFDCLLAYYLSQNSSAEEWRQRINAFPSIWRQGAVTAYAEPHANDLAATDDVYCVSGAYRADRGATGEVGVSWAVRKKTWVNDNAETLYYVDIKWATTDIHVLGWDNATDGPLDTDGVGGLSRPRPDSDYNFAQYRTQNIDPGGASFIYIGIRRQDAPAGQFRQIVLPVNDGDYPPHLTD